MLKPDKLQIIVNEVFGSRTKKPNKFTVGMGKLIRVAREELGWSQSELAVNADMRRATLSNIENGKSEPSTTQLFYLSINLKKPVMHFFPKFARIHLEKEDLTPLELELISFFRVLENDKIKKIAVNQLKALEDI